jgi:hypothetical protein
VTGPPAEPTAEGGIYASRPGSVSATGVLLIVLGALRELFSLIGLVLLIGAGDELSGIASAGAVIAVAVVAILITAGIGILQILGGVNALQQRRRAIVLAVVGCSMGILLAVLGILGGGSGPALTMVINAAVLIGDVVALILVTQSGRHMTLP